MQNDSLPVSVQLHLEEVCARFEAAWKAAGSAATAPRIEEHLGAAAGPGRAALLRELLRLDVHYRRRHGENPGANYYAARCPADAEVVRALFAELSGVPQPPRQAAPAADGSRGTMRPGPAAETALDPDRTGPAEAPAESSKSPAIPDYEILGELGRGGMGVVYKARQPGLKRLAALKMILSGDYASPEELARFRREAEAIARLCHPHIVQVYEVGEYDGRPFFSLEYVDGGTLAAKLRVGLLDPKAAAALVEKLARAMHAVHQCSVVHRDLKPANVLLTADGTPKITDFGLAKKLDEDAGQTHSGAIMGTPSYMAPEQASGGAARATPLADVYALGAILYECLTGRPPFRAATVGQTLRQVLDDEPVAPRRLNPAVPRDLETVCLKCLEKGPAKRYADAYELAEDLRRFLALEPVRARPVGRAERLGRWARRNPVVAGLTAAAAALLVLVAVVGGVGYVQTSAALGAARIARDEEAKQRQEADHQKEQALRQEAQARRERDMINGLFYAAQMPRAYRLWEAGDLTRLRRLLAQHLPRPGWTDHRAWEWYYLEALCRDSPWAVRGHADPVLALAWSADGKRLASADGTGTIKLWDAAAGREISTVRAHAGAVYVLSWGPDGKRLASAGADNPHPINVGPSQARVKIWDVSTGKEILSLSGAAGGWLAPAPAWSPDGQRLAVAGPEGVRVWELATGKEALTLRGHLDRVAALAWSPDGTRLASLGGDGMAKVWEAATGKPVYTLRGLVDTSPGVHDAGLLAWAAGGRQLFGARPEGKIVVWDAATGAEVRNRTLFTPFLRGGPAHSPGLAFTPRGQRLAVTSGSHGTGETIHIWDTELGKELLPLRTTEGPGARLGSIPLPLTWSPDGEYLARGGADGFIKVLKVSAVRKLTRTVRTGSGNPPVWSHDSRAIITPGREGTIQFWDAVTGEVTRTLGGATREMTAVNWSRDGRRLATGNRVGQIDLWDVASGKNILTLEGHSHEISSLSWGPGDRRLASLSAGRPGGGQVRVWDTATGRQTLAGDLPGLGPRARLLLAWSPGGDWLATAAQGGGGQVWDAGTGTQVLTLERAYGLGAPGVVALAWRADRGQLVTAGRHGVVKVWDAAAGKEVSSQRVPRPPGGAPAGEPGLSWSPDGRRLALMGREGTLQVWDSASDQVVLTLRTPDASPLAPIEAVWSPDGRRLVSSAPNRASRDKVQVWDTSSGKELFSRDGIKRLGQPPLAGWLTWAPDGRRLAAALAEGVVEVWDVEKGQTLFSLRAAPRGDSQALADWLSWSADGRRLAVVNPSGTVTVRDAASGNETLTLGSPRTPAPRGSDVVTLVASSPDGRLLASTSDAGAVSLWEAATGRVRLTLEEPPSAPQAIAWSPDGSRLAVYRARGTLEVWDTATGKKSLTLGGSGWAAELAWSPDGKHLAASNPGAVQVWDATSGQEVLAVRDQPGPALLPMAWSPDGLSFASVSRSPGKDSGSLVEEVMVWDVTRRKETLALRRTLENGKKGATVALGWSPAGRWLAGHRSDGVIKVWDAATGKDVLTLPSEISLQSTGAAASVWSPDGKRLATVTADGTIKVVDPATGEEHLSVRSQPATWLATRRPGAAVLRVLAWSPDGKRLASATDSLRKDKNVWEGEGKVWDARTGKHLATLDPHSGVGRLVWSPDGRRLAAVSRDRGGRGAKVWDAATGRAIPLPAPAKGAWSWLSWAPDGRRLAVGTYGTVQVWDAASAKALTPLLALYSPGPSQDRSVAWSPDGRRLAVAGPDWTVKVWDAATGKEALSLGRSKGQTNLQPPENRVVLAWSGDGKQLASSAGLERTIQIWDPASGANLLTLPGHPRAIRSLAWSRDGRRLASAGDDGAVKVWDVAAGKEILSLRYARPPRELSTHPGPPAESLLAWDADGGRLAAAGADGAVTVWDVLTGKEAATLSGRKAAVSSVAWSPDGRRLASAGEDGTVSLWDTTAGQEVLTLRYTQPQLARPGSVAWSPDGRRLAVAFFDELSNAAVMVWDTAPGMGKPGPKEDGPEK
jgi:WD40 repeat protein/tRNA A-37 threonylcarbamoyl transferase component Bud32